MIVKVTKNISTDIYAHSVCKITWLSESIKKKKKKTLNKDKSINIYISYFTRKRDDDK